MRVGLGHQTIFKAGDLVTWEIGGGIRPDATKKFPDGIFTVVEVDDLTGRPCCCTGDDVIDINELPRINDHQHSCRRNDALKAGHPQHATINLGTEHRTFSGTFLKLVDQAA